MEKVVDLTKVSTEELVQELKGRNGIMYSEVAVDTPVIIGTTIKTTVTQPMAAILVSR